MGASRRDWHRQVRSGGGVLAGGARRRCSGRRVHSSRGAVAPGHPDGETVEYAPEHVGCNSGAPARLRAAGARTSRAGCELRREHGRDRVGRGAARPGGHLRRGRRPGRVQVLLRGLERRAPLSTARGGRRRGLVALLRRLSGGRAPGDRAGAGRRARARVRGARPADEPVGFRGATSSTASCSTRARGSAGRRESLATLDAVAARRRTAGVHRGRRVRATLLPRPARRAGRARGRGTTGKGNSAQAQVRRVSQRRRSTAAREDEDMAGHAVSFAMRSATPGLFATMR